MKISIGAAFKAGVPWVKNFCEDLHKETLIPFTLNLVGFNFSNTDSITNLEADNIVIRKGGHGVSENWNYLVSMGIRQNADYIGIWNDDTVAFPKEENSCWLSKMIEYMEINQKIAVVSPSWFWTGDDESSITKFKTQAKDNAVQNAGKETIGLQGFAMLFRKKALEDLERSHPGFWFDETLYCMWEEGLAHFELWKLGWESRILHYIPWYHFASRTLKSMGPGWSNGPYAKGKEYFLNKTQAPSHVYEWTFHNGFYQYKLFSGDEWHKWK